MADKISDALGFMEKPALELTPEGNSFKARVEPSMLETIFYGNLDHELVKKMDGVVEAGYAGGIIQGSPHARIMLTYRDGRQETINTTDPELVADLGFPVHLAHRVAGETAYDYKERESNTKKIIATLGLAAIIVGFGVAVIGGGYLQKNDDLSPPKSPDQYSTTDTPPVTGKAIENATEKTPPKTTEDIVEQIKEKQPEAIKQEPAIESAEEDPVAKAYSNVMSGEFGNGDRVDLSSIGYEVKGTISSGKIKNGETWFLTLRDEKGNLVFSYGRAIDCENCKELAKDYDLPTTDIAMIEIDTDSDGELDEVRIELDGEDSGYRFKYLDEGMGGLVGDYIFLLTNSDNPKVQEYILESP